MVQEQAFLAAIIAEPERDDMRLIYADWLSEHGQEDRGEWIRLQCRIAVWLRGGVLENDVELFRREKELWPVGLFGILDEVKPILPADAVVYKWNEKPRFTSTKPELYVNRGFIGEVNFPLAAWIGQRCERCERCDGDGKAHGSDRPFEWSGPGTYPGHCPVCNGDGLVGGHGREIVARQPVTSVRTIDVDPTFHREDFLRDKVELYSEDYHYNHAGDKDVLPRGVFSLLVSGKGFGSSDPVTVRRYDTPAAAHADLSQALPRWARGERASAALQRQQG